MVRPDLRLLDRTRAALTLSEDFTVNLRASIERFHRFAERGSTSVAASAPDGQVVDDLDRPIPGLYGVGNCLASASARA